MGTGQWGRQRSRGAGLGGLLTLPEREPFLDRCSARHLLAWIQVASAGGRVAAVAHLCLLTSAVSWTLKGEGSVAGVGWGEGRSSLPPSFTLHFLSRALLFGELGGGSGTAVHPPARERRQPHLTPALGTGRP